MSVLPDYSLLADLSPANALSSHHSLDVPPLHHTASDASAVKSSSGLRPEAKAFQPPAASSRAPIKMEKEAPVTKTEKGVATVKPDKEAAGGAAVAGGSDAPPSVKREARESAPHDGIGSGEKSKRARYPDDSAPAAAGGAGGGREGGTKGDSGRGGAESGKDSRSRASGERIPDGGRGESRDRLSDKIPVGDKEVGGGASPPKDHQRGGGRGDSRRDSEHKDASRDKERDKERGGGGVAGDASVRGTSEPRGRSGVRPSTDRQQQRDEPSRGEDAPRAAATPAPGGGEGGVRAPWDRPDHSKVRNE